MVSQTKKRPLISIEEYELGKSYRSKRDFYDVLT